MHHLVYAKDYTLLVYIELLSIHETHSVTSVDILRPRVVKLGNSQL